MRSSSAAEQIIRDWSPVAGIRHRAPWLLRWQRVALLQDLDGVEIGRADEGHLTVARRAIDGDAELHQAVAGCVNVVDLISEMAEMPVLAIGLFVPIVGEFDQRRAATSLSGQGREVF